MRPSNAAQPEGKEGKAAMKIHPVILLLVLIFLTQARPAEEKPILEIAPTLAELGAGWTTNIVAYLLDPLSKPAVIAYRGNSESDRLLDHLRTTMK